VNSIRGISISAAVLLLGAAAGCAHSGSSSAAAPAGPATPSASVAAVATPGTPQELSAALRKSAPQPNYAFTATLPDVQAKGSVEPGAADVTVVSTYDDETDTAEIRVLGGTRYMRLGVKSKDFDKAKSSSDPALRAATRLFNGQTWFTVDPHRLKSALLTVNLDDVVGIGQFLGHAAPDLGTAQQMSGTVNLAATKGQHGLIDYDVFKGTAALQTFTATLDPQGRLLTCAQDATAPQWAFKFSGYGTQQQPAAPTGAKPLPTPMYDWIND